MNISMLKQAQQLKSKLNQAQKELKDTIIEIESAKGAIKVTINGQQKILSIKISPEVINRDKAEHLEKLVLQAINEAQDKSQKLAAKQLKDLTGGIKIPGLT